MFCNPDRGFCDNRRNAYYRAIRAGFSELLNIRQDCIGIENVWVRYTRGVTFEDSLKVVSGLGEIKCQHMLFNFWAGMFNFRKLSRI